MINRRKVLGTLGAMGAMGFGALAGPFATFAQGKVWRIGYLILSPVTEKPSPERAAFLDGLRALGYVEGQNLKIEYRSAQLEPDFLPELALDLVKSGVEVIFVVESVVVRAALKATSTVPIVFVSTNDPIEMDFAKSLSRPGKNVTGITLLGATLAPKRLELLRDLLPAAKRIAVLRVSASVGAHSEWLAIQPVAAKLGFTLESFQVRDSGEFPHQLALIARSKPDALCVLSDNRTISARSILADFALANRLPSIMGFAGYAQAGGLLSLAPNFTDNFRRAATYVDKILKGAKPGELPIEQPSTFELAVNLKTAKALGIKIPPSILVRADRVIE